MDERKLHRTWRYMRHIHPWYFLILTILCGAITTVALRANNNEMGRLRNAVFVADKDNGDIESALQNLRHYIYGHMNTSLTSGENAVYPPIQLKYRYERLEAQQQQGLGANNSLLYGQALQACNQEGETSSVQATIACIQSFMAARGIQLSNIPSAMYEFDFVSAKWSPDLAGWSLVLTVMFGLAFIISALYGWLAKHYAA